MWNFPKHLTFHVGKYVSDLIYWLKHRLGFLFDFIKHVLLWLLTEIQDFLLWLPWWAFIVLIFLIGWRFRNTLSGVTFSAMIFIIGMFGLWDAMMQTMSLVLSSVIIALIIGIPIGIFMSYGKWFEAIMKPILDGMQTMPSFIYLIPAMLLLGLGKVPGVFATLVYALPPVIRLTNLAIRSVPHEVVEAGQSFGSSKSQLLFKVQVPQALPTIMTGVNQTTMMALAMVVICSMIGAGGLGMQVLLSINRLDIAMGFEAGISIVFLAIIIDRVTMGIVDKFQQ